MAGSILDDIKQGLGLASDDNAFDVEILLHLNSVLADLNQLGIGPDEGLMIEDSTPTWADLLNNEKRINNVKSYMVLRVKMLFDPPTLGYLITMSEKAIEKAEWRITNAQDDIVNPVAVTTLDPPEYTVDGVDWGEVTVVDGGEV